LETEINSVVMMVCSNDFTASKEILFQSKSVNKSPVDIVSKQGFLFSLPKKTRPAMSTGFSGAVVLTDLNDYISPSQACVKPVEGPVLSDRNGQEVGLFKGSRLLEKRFLVL
jgi:hypothetical protein